MFLWIISLLLLINVAMGETGKVSRILGGSDAYLTRAGGKMLLTAEMSLEQGDVIATENSVVVIEIRPTTQISLAKKTQISLSKIVIDKNNSKNHSLSIVQFLKGIIRVQVTKDPEWEVEQTIEADGVSFAVRGTEFEVSKEVQDFNLDVVEGEVVVSSPFVQTFVPEIVKANEGFSFNKNKREFKRRKFKLKFKNHPGFKKRRKGNK